MTDTAATDPALVTRIRSRLSIARTGSAPGPQTPAGTRAAVAAALAEEGVTDPAVLPTLVRDIADQVAGLGPLERLLRTPGVSDVMVNAPNDVWIERDGRLERIDLGLASRADLLDAVRRVIATRGGRLDRAHPFVDTQLADGSRLHAVIEPIVPAGPVVTIRRFDRRQLGWADLEHSGAVPGPAAAILRQLVAERRGLVVCGRTGVGKTTLLQLLLGQVSHSERVVLIEDAPELQPATAHLVRLQTRPASAEGAGEIDAGTLVRQALRMRPDRIVVGEVRGREIADVLQALVTGHEGCMTTVHASSAEEALVRLEGLALLAGLPLAAARAQIAAAVDAVVALGRDQEGRRGVTQIAAIRSDGDRPTATPLWERQ
ncbi:CpaF family protein [Euzebya tangerina]|uniref:CpaF family protein n=1 Tax=Euzebya tangerina TaxID=591198 RepID=UPI000E320362|nr:ATPase, T2SS/T4P/T4SS family [Euzebya tangerina]